MRRGGIPRFCVAVAGEMNYTVTVSVACAKSKQTQLTGHYEKEIYYSDFVYSIDRADDHSLRGKERERRSDSVRDRCAHECSHEYTGAHSGADSHSGAYTDAYAGADSHACSHGARRFREDRLQRRIQHEL